MLSIEESKTLDVQLQETARFCHHPFYLKDVAKRYHLNCLSEESIIGRMQAQEGVSVILYAFRLKQDHLSA
ncbi:MAG: hypothetical protein ACOYKA_07265, partial [Legionellaceae bacterium]